MTNPFQYSGDNKRYHTLNYYNKQRGIIAKKAVVDAGFTCPNIDGTKGSGGCIYCDGGSGYFAAKPSVPIEKQLTLELDRIRQKDPNAAAIAYFQAHTNTYASVERLRELFERALSVEGICGLSIATRADAIEADTLAYLSELNERTFLTLELGLQTIHDSTAYKINRCHNYSDFTKSFEELKIRGIRTCVHLINGLPGEDTDMMIKSAEAVGHLYPHAVKLHLLHVIRGTALEGLYESGEYDPMDMDSYIDVIVRQLEVLPPETVIERITGDGDKRTMAAPAWSRDKIRILGSIDKVMADRNTWQGKYFIR